jgi:hypothetical protein
MLLSSQITVVRQWIVDAIAACPELDPVPLERVVWSDQDWPDRAYPYVLLSYTGSVEQGLSPAQWIDDADDEITRTGDNTTLSITAVNKPSDTAPTDAQQASSYIRELKARLKSFAGDSLRLAQLAIRDVNVALGISQIQGLSQWESRAALDITFGHAATISETPGVIETVEVTGTTTPATPSQPQTIPA